MSRPSWQSSALEIGISRNLPPLAQQRMFPRTLTKMSRGQDVITEPEKVKNWEQRLNETEEERMILRRERDELCTTVKVLKEKTTPELLHELQEKFLKSCKRTQDMYLFSIL